MIFFFGTRGVNVLSEPLQNATCAHCQQNKLYLVVNSRHFHLFWIPMFPVGKSVYTVCTHCKQTLPTNQMPPDYKAAIANHQGNAKTPIWQFTGLMIIGFFIAMILISVIITAINKH